MLGGGDDRISWELGGAFEDLLPGPRTRRHYQQAPEGAAVGAEGLDARDVRLVDQHQPGARVLHLVAENLAQVPGVDRHLDSPDQRQPKPGVDELDRVVEHHEHRLAGLHTLGGECGRRPAGARPQVAVGVRGDPEVDADPVGPPLGRRLDGLADRARGLDRRGHDRNRSYG